MSHSHRHSLFNNNIHKRHLSPLRVKFVLSQCQVRIRIYQGKLHNIANWTYYLKTIQPIQIISFMVNID